MNANDICCSTCSHKDVCALKGDYQMAQAAVDDCSVNMGNSEHGRMLKRLRDFDFIERVKLKCKHYQRYGITLRDGNLEVH